MNIVNTKIQHTNELFAGGHSCAQSVLLSWAKDHGVRTGDAFRIAAGFGGGMAFGEVCGAVSGAIMVIGLEHASAIADPADQDSKNFTYEMSRRFMEQFRSRAGAICCRDLIGFDLSRIEKNQSVMNASRKLYEKCPGFVQTASEILEEILKSAER
jgi:C_GCAxxG_C_C family probable redox protein